MIALTKHLRQAPRRYSYRFLFIPGTIGSITWLARNEHRVAAIKHGLVIAGVADRGAMTYKKSRRGNAEIDTVFEHILKCGGGETSVVDFDPYGYDERQFCSPGFNLPVGRISRTPHGQYPEYHTSADNLDFISVDALQDSFDKCASALALLENNKYYLNQNPKCEPQLGKRGLYRPVGGQPKSPLHETALLWVLNLSDGEHNLLDIAERSALPFDIVQAAANALVEGGLLVEHESADN
jgi:aminopeptidase-like protein